MLERKAFRWPEYFKVNILFFALAALSQSLHSIILPVRILDFVSEAQKNTFLGIMTFAGLFIAVLYQPVAGALSDRASTIWGRRRPFIMLGICTLILCVAGVGLAPGYIFLFITYLLMQFAGNTAQGPYQALLPEMVPAEKRGRASAIKNLLEILGGVAMIGVASVLITRYETTHLAVWLWLTLAAIIALLCLSLIVTLVWIKEVTPQRTTPQLSPWSAIRRTFRLDLPRDRPFLWFLLSRALILMALGTIQQFALYFFRDVVGLENPAEAAFGFLGVAIAVVALGAYPAGRLVDRFPRQKVSAMAAGLGALGIILIMILPKEYHLILIPAGLIGAALVVFATANWALATDLAVPGEEARYLGLANMATAGGAALARLIGPVIDFFNARSPNQGYQVMLGVCVVYFVMGGLILLKVKGASPEAG
ncbi:MAG: MFS transporter [Dehalococcoidia bacterium]|nr:MFS transporter [Dehalococcoidia bacterium]